MGLYASKTPIEPVTAGPIADGLDIFRYVVHGIYITLILILILIIVFCPRCSVICDNFCWPYIRTHYNSLANNNTTDDDTPTETAPAKTDVHSTKKNFAVPPETHPKRQTKADIVLAPGGGDKINSPASSVNLTLVFFLVIILLLLGLIAVVVYWLYCTKGGKKGKLFPWSKSSKSKSHKSSKKSQYPQTEESIKAERRAAVFS
ncbi:hypothetical protein TYRP_014674 [Tyrophagus putrescentiae]|nr:hypothetical protein TYRP_014674 [Tyrophagus putrescentiae]